jgi:hypothetical protein
MVKLFDEKTGRCIGYTNNNDNRPKRRYKKVVLGDIGVDKANKPKQIVRKKKLVKGKLHPKARPQLQSPMGFMNKQTMLFGGARRSQRKAY